MSTVSAKQVMQLRNETGVGMMDCKAALIENEGDLEKAKLYLRKRGLALAEKKAGRKTDEGAIKILIDDARRNAAMVSMSCETDFVARNEAFGSLLQELTEQALEHGDQNFLEQSTASGTVQDKIANAISKLGENIQFDQCVKLSTTEKGFIGHYLHSNSKNGVLVVLEGNNPNPEEWSAIATDLAMHIAANNVLAVSEESIDPELIEKERRVYMEQAQESGKPEDIATKMVEGRMRKFLAEMSLMQQPFVKRPDVNCAEFLKEHSQRLGDKLSVQSFVKFTI